MNASAKGAISMFLRFLIQGAEFINEHKKRIKIKSKD